MLINSEEPSLRIVRRRIAGFVILTFYGYLSIGLPLAVLPIFIHNQLGYSTLVAGAIISLQYLSTFALRGYGGSIVDKQGPKRAVHLSMLGFIVSGLLLLAAFLLQAMPMISLSILLLSRLATGCAEGLIGASPINWAMLIVGEKHTATAISYNGIASYGALAVGAPLGVWMASNIGLWSLGLFMLAIGLFGVFYAARKPSVVGSLHAPRQPFIKVLKLVSSYGICLAMGGIGFGTLSTFITLYYAYLHWANAALCLTMFSTTFILGRIFFGKTIDRYGGIQVAICSLALESLGLFALWLAPNPQMAVLAAGITGLGFALLFPALGVEAVKLASASNKGAALAAYGLFVDISLGITGPTVGFVANNYGLANIFPFSAVMVGIGLLLCIYLSIKVQRATVSMPLNR